MHWSNAEIYQIATGKQKSIFITRAEALAIYTARYNKVLRLKDPNALLEFQATTKNLAKPTTIAYKIKPS